MKLFLIKIIKVILFVFCIVFSILCELILTIFRITERINKLIQNFEEFLFAQIGFFVNWLDAFDECWGNKKEN